MDEFEPVWYDEGVGNRLLNIGYGVFELPWYVEGFEATADDVGIEGYGSITFEPVLLLYAIFHIKNKDNNI